MKNKITFCAVAILGGVLFGSAARAQFVVTDPANDTAQGLNLAKLIEQAATLAQQLQTMKDMYSAMNGSFDMSSLTPENFTKNIPTDWKGTLDNMNGGSQSSILARATRDATSQFKTKYFTGVSARDKALLGDRLDSASSNQALNGTAYDETMDRFARLDLIRARIPFARTVKDVEDLQAKIQIEQAMIMNEMLRLQAENGMDAANNRVTDEKHRQEDYQITDTKY